MTNSMPLRVAVTGVTGRMGQEIIRCIDNSSGHQQHQYINSKIVLGAAIAHKTSKVCGMDIGTVSKVHTSGIIVTDDIESVKENFDVLIDFTTPQATIEYLNFCVLNHKNMIIGTTGFNENYFSLIKSASKEIGIVCSANFSIGIAVMMKLLAEVTKNIENFVNIDIVETHHNKKNDIPSGTALMIRDHITDNIKKNKFLYRSSDSVNYRDNISTNNLLLDKSLISECDVKIHSIRSGDIVGEHIVLFSGIGECLEVTHKAFNRSIFAVGALYAALWVRNKKSGLFDINSILNFNTF